MSRDGAPFWVIANITQRNLNRTYLLLVEICREQGRMKHRVLFRKWADTEGCVAKVFQACGVALP